MIIFAVKSAITLAVLYSCFFLFLSRETFHRFNRWMLLGMMVTSLIVPFIHITTDTPTIINDGLFTLQQELEPQTMYISQSDITSTAAIQYATSHEKVPFNWAGAIVIAYRIGFVVMFLFTIVQLVMIAKAVRGGLRHTDSMGNTVVLKPGKFAPFSFFRYIVMNVDDYENNRQAILTHEQEHIRLLHSWDNMFVAFMKILQWFNPFIYLLSRDLDAVHEFEADEAVINNGIDAKTYQQLLVVKATGMRLQTLVNGLNRTSLKKRIIMMYQKKSNRWLMLKAAFALPVLVIAVGAFATPAISGSISQALNTIEEQEIKMSQNMQTLVDEDNPAEEENDIIDEALQVDNEEAKDTVATTNENKGIHIKDIDVHSATPNLAPLIEKITAKYSTTKAETSDWKDGTCSATYQFLIPANDVFQMVSDLRTAFAADGSKAIYQNYNPRSGKKIVTVPYKDKLFVLRDNDNLETHIIIADLPEPEYSDKSLCIAFSWNNYQNLGHLEGKVRLLLNKKSDNVLFANELELKFDDETYKRMFIELAKNNEDDAVSEDANKFRYDINKMVSEISRRHPFEGDKLRGLYSLYFTAIAEAEALEKKCEESHNGVYQYRDQAMERRKYAQKIMKKIEKTISKIYN